MASLPEEDAQPPSIKHGIRVVADPTFYRRTSFVGPGRAVGHENIVYGSRMNKAVVAFLRKVHLVHNVVESGLVLENDFVAVSPLFVPSVRVTVSGVPPFISNESIERELVRFGKLASGLKPVRLGCKDARLQHVHSLRRQCFMYLNDPSGTLELSFAVKWENRHYTLYVSSGHMRCFECGDVGHKRASCPHREPRAGESEREAGAAEPQGVTQGETQTEQEQPGPSGAAEAQAEAEMPSETQVNENAETQIEEETDARGETVASAPPTAQEEVESEGAAEGGSELCEENNDYEEDMEEEDALSQRSDLSQDVGQEEPPLYSAKVINEFLDVTYGNKAVNVQDFFPDVEGFISSVQKLKRQVGLDQLSQKKSSVIIVGGDWNSTIHQYDRNSVEPHPNAASLLTSVVRENDLIDTWRQCHSTVRQYTWVRGTAPATSPLYL
ncbi:hypothetical protein WMY93_008722 [Mugilogobius chulae]|uniref:CCHC-type domain-containing protein n=1 Tax=Mugilogobius chulae TaxID=88201 RepID=A0AAW0PDC4_9GOBI